jgi:hypothetical protein
MAPPAKELINQAACHIAQQTHQQSSVGFENALAVHADMSIHIEVLML